VLFVWPMAFPHWPIDIAVGQCRVPVAICPIAAAAS
jgi:hypothetical protein